MTFQELQPKVTAITLNNSLSETKLYRFANFKDNIDYYNWVGFTLQIKNLKRCI
jgi:GAF domain-containing protein